MKTICALLAALDLLGFAWAAPAAPKAFPTAEGFGANAVGGRGGRVIEVTNLNDSGNGSLRSAMETSGRRICVFRVSGTITLKRAIRVSQPYLTVAGQTSPGGVQIKGSGQPDGDWGVWFVNGAHDNWSGNNASVFGQFALNTSAFGNVVSNLWLAGPESGYPYLNVGNGGPTRIDGSPADDGGTRLYLTGNGGPRCPMGCTNDWIGHGVNTWDYYERDHDGSTHLVDQAQYDAGKPFPTPPVVPDPVSALRDRVLAGVGAHKPSRDPVDLRIVQSVRDKTGTSRIDTTGLRPAGAFGAGTDAPHQPRPTTVGSSGFGTAEIGPWPDLAHGAPAPPTDSDHDGMPDAWESAHGLDPQDARDGATVAANGYTNVENYLNELAGDPIH